LLHRTGKPNSPRFVVDADRGRQRPATDLAAL
jgi:hypothetical protein